MDEEVLEKSKAKRKEMTLTKYLVHEKGNILRLHEETWKSSENDDRGKRTNCTGNIEAYVSDGESISVRDQYNTWCDI